MCSVVCSKRRPNIAVMIEVYSVVDSPGGNHAAWRYSLRPTSELSRDRLDVGAGH